MKAPTHRAYGRFRSTVCLLSAFLCLGAVGCDHLPGRPAPGPEVPVPSAELNIDKLYVQNCSGCHGDNRQHGAAIPLNNPAYLAWVDKAALRNVTANGYKAGLMPGFSEKAGGMLTDAQIDVVVNGMLSKWGRGNVLAGLNAPAYAATSKGDIKRGEQVYQAACLRCHGAAAERSKRSSILNGSYLALVNEQTLRTAVVIGRPELGMPDWRGDIAGKPLTDSDVTDVVAWMQSFVPAEPGQPYPSKTPGNSNPLPTNQSPGHEPLPNHKGGK